MARTPTPANAGDQTPTPPETGTETGTSPETTTETQALESDADEGDLIEARVLRAFGEYEPNDIVMIPAGSVDAVAAGDVDPNPAAVAYAKSLRA